MRRLEKSFKTSASGYLSKWFPRGNLGPRITEIRNGERIIIVNADHPEKTTDQLNKQSFKWLFFQRILGSTKYILFAVPVLVLAAILLLVVPRRRWRMSEKLH